LTDIHHQGDAPGACRTVAQLTLRETGVRDRVAAAIDLERDPALRI
jgi:hypothetical protein